MWIGLGTWTFYPLCVSLFLFSIHAIGTMNSFSIHTLLVPFVLPSNTEVFRFTTAMPRNLNMILSYFLSYKQNQTYIKHVWHLKNEF